MVIEEAFAVLARQEQPDSLSEWTVEALAHRAQLPVEGVLRRLESIETMAESIEIGPEELRALMERKGVYLLDVRQRWEFEKCQIEGSHLMATLDLAKIFEGLKEMQVITICHHGVRSMSAAFYLREAGLPRVRSLHGGLDLWAQVIDRDMARY
jgi:rhodanese-related sulfurtransferase